MAVSPVLAYSPHPILLGKERELVYAAFLPNETIAEYLLRTGILARMGRQPFTLTVDGRRLPRTLWAHCRPKPGTLVNLYATVRGGDGKKNPLATIAMLALIVWAPGVAPQVGSAFGVSTAVAQAGLMVVGGLVVNSIFPPPRPDLARAQNLGGSDSPTYAIAGGSNRMRRYEPMPKIIGVHRVFPDFGAQPYSEFEGGDQVGYYVFDFGYNDCDLTDFKIGDTPIGEFEGVEMEISGADGKLALFPGNVDSVAGVELTEALGFVSRTSSPEARSLAVEITGALFYLGDSGTEQRAATVNIEYRPVGGGAWTGLQFAPDTVPATSIVNGVARVPVAQYTHGARREITVQPAASYTPITALSASVNTPAGNGLFRHDGFTKASGVTLAWTPPGGSRGAPVALRGGGQFLLYDASRTMDVLIFVDPDFVVDFATGSANPFPTATVGPNEIPGEFLLLNASREPLRRTLLWHVAEGQYEVRVKKSSLDETNLRATAQLVWSQLRTYQPDDADYTGRLRVGMKVRASALANGVLQQLSCIARARCQVWDGAQFIQAHTSNPAFWVLDALRGKTVNGRRVYGAGRADARIDIEGLKAFAAWCDAEGLEFNGVFDQQTSIYELLSALALMGRGTPTMQTGKHGVLWDAPALPVTALFGMHNIVAGSFEIEYATGDMADVIEGWFINQALNWQRDFVRALVPGATSQARVRRVELFGCTDNVQAGEAVNLYAAANTYRPRRYKWRSDWEQMPCPRGDVAMIGHDLLQLLSGRFIEGGNATTLKLPRKVPLFDVGAFITIRKPDQTFATYAVEAGTGETDTLTLSAPLPFDPWADPEGYPPYDYRWHYGPASTTGRKVKIESFKPVSERHVDVSAVDEDPAYYAAKDNATVPLPAPSVFGQVQLAAVNVTEDGVRAGTGYLAKVLVSWDVTGDYGFADVRVSVNGGPVELLGATVRGRSFSFNVQDFSDVVVEVTAWSSFGRHGKSSKLTVEHHVDYAGQSVPSDVGSFLLDGDKFRWAAAPEVDVIGYRIRYHFGENRSIADAHELHQGTLAASPAQFDVLPAGVVTFFLTAVDAAQLESATPAIIVKDLGDPELANVVEEKDFKAEAWPGTVTGGSNVGGDLEADGTTAFYGSDNASFYGADADPFYEDEVYSEMVYESVGFYFSNDWIGSAMTIEHVLEGEGLNLEYRQSNDEPFYGADADAFYGADADPFYGDVGDWRAWPGTVTFDGGDYQLRVTTGAGPIQGAVRELTVVIDVPDVVDELNDIAIPAGGVRLTLTKDFDLIKTVQLTLQTGDGDAVSARALDKDVVLGPLVECIDEAKVSVAGILDATITGR
jgi:hypothetical protein